MVGRDVCGVVGAVVRGDARHRQFFQCDVRIGGGLGECVVACVSARDGEAGNSDNLVVRNCLVGLMSVCLLSP